MTRILIVEDDSDIRGMLARGLEAEGFEVGTAGNVDDALSAARAESPNAVVLDITLPDGSGHDVCRSLRAGGYPGPILFLSARDEVRDRVEGLALGADDYIVKPFSPREVVARVRAVLRRASAAAPHAEPPFVLDDARFEARVHGKALTLTPVEFRLLKKLAAQPGRVFSRTQLIDALYLDHRIVSDRTVDSHVKNLRRKLAEAGVDAIGSVYGVGYRLEWPASDGAPDSTRSTY